MPLTKPLITFPETDFELCDKRINLLEPPYVMRFKHTFLTLLISASLFSQNKEPGYKEYFLEGTYLLVENMIDKAKENFEIAYRIDSTNANINYLLGVCYLQMPLEKSKAEYYLEKAVKRVSPKYKMDDPSEKSAAPIAHFYYGQALHVNYKFEEAQKQFDLFRKYLDPKDQEYLKILNKEITTTKLAVEKVQKPVNVKITNLGDSINTEWPEYSAVLSADENMMIFTTKRPTSLGGMKDDNGQYPEDIVVSYKDAQERWSKPVPLSYNVNSIGHEASINLTPDGQTLIVFRNDVGKNPEGDGNIYYTTFDGKDWTPLKEFATNVNTEFWESHACLSSDGNVLFFSSERPGGYGGKDIYRCVKLPNGQWSKALNMGPLINSEYDEDGGYIHPDGRTFYFASNGPRSMGGYDIMFATLNEDNKFDYVTNIGYPINTTDDDIFYVTSPDGKRGYFSSAQAGGYGDKDIYRITIAEARETFLALFKGQLIPAEGETLPDNIVIVVTDKQSNELVGNYRPKTVNGTFSTILPPGKEYNFSYQTDNGEEFYNEDVFVSNDVAYQEIRREVALEPVRLGGKVKAKIKDSTEITLNAVVLDNARSKKPVAGAKLVVEEIGGKTEVYEPDASGKVNDIRLQPNKKYRIYTEINGKRSEATEVSTEGISSGKILSQMVYTEGKPAARAKTRKLMLDVMVKAIRTWRAVPEATVIIKDIDGEKTEHVTDRFGRVRGIELSPDNRYELVAVRDSNISEAITFTTGAVGKGRKFAKTLLIHYQTPQEIAAAVRRAARLYMEPGSYYKFTYKYGKKVINEEEKSWKMFIDYIARKSQERPKVIVYIKASASRVPTRMRGGNARLAAIRGKNFELLIRSNLQQRGVDMKKVKFLRKSVVGGPRYIGDWKIGRRKYEKHQYVRGRVK
jgi:tetratricopeptide (TPR) repeat protein